MKPSFALTLSNEKVGLLHRSAQGWHPVGEVALSEPELPAALGYLRGSALGLEPQGLSCKLVIPNSEILYLTVRAPGPSAAERQRQIAAALEGRTPYAVDELVFDWSGSGDEVQVAVVAKQTLAEAEAFAVEHRFNPVSFVAMPPPGAFEAEPWFGTTAAAETIVASGTRIERDQDPIRIVAREMPRPTARPEVLAAPTAAVEPPAQGAAAGAEIAPSEPPAEPSPPPVAPASTMPPRPAEPPPAVSSSAASAASATKAAEPAATPRAGTATDRRALAPADPPPPPAPPPPSPAPSVKASAPDPGRVAAPGRAPGPAPVSAPEPPPATEQKAESAGKRRPIGPLDPLPPAPPPRREAEIRVLPPRPSVTTSPAATGAATPRGDGASPVQLRPIGDPTPDPSRRASVPLRTVSSETVQKPLRPPAKLPPARPGAKGRGAAAVPAAIPMRPSPAAQTLRPVPPDGLPPPEGGEARARTASAADNALARARAANRRRLPTGLILTGILVVLLAAVAIWAAIFLDPPPERGAADPTLPPPSEAATAELRGQPVEVPAGPRPVGADEAAPPAGALEPEEAPAAAMAPDATEPAQAPATAADPAGAAAPELPPVAADAVPASPPTFPEAEAAPDALAAARGPPEAAPAANPPAVPRPRAADPEAAAPPPEPPPAVAGTDRATGDRQLGAPPFDEIFLPSTDPRIALAGRPYLGPTDSARTDAAPLVPMAPPPFGTVYRFDAEGRIIATPEGIVTPEGVRVVAGRPAIVPPARPDAAAAAAPDEATVAAAPAAPAASAAPAAETTVTQAAPAAAPETTTQPAGEAAAPATDPRLAAGRPRARPGSAPPPAATPESLTPESESALEEAPPPGGIRITSLRPRERSGSVRAQDVALRAAEAAEAVAASSLAVAISRKPAVRPASFAAIPAAAAAAPARAAAPRATAPEAEPEVEIDDDEPPVTRAAPAIPTRASVARQATVTGALNLNRINLIGVYGTANNRHALVRMPGGDFQRVRVGDRLDGGQVSAIGESDLRYSKGGRMVTLTMPRG
jgi:hypothetical protein